MTYFKKMGRLSDEEQAVVDVIEQIRIEKDIALSEVPICNSLDDLLEAKLLLETYDPESIESQNEGEAIEQMPIEEAQEIQEDQPASFEELEQAEIEPVSELQNEVQEETQLIEQEPSEEEIEPMEVIENSSSNVDAPEFIASDYDPFSDEIIERSYNANDTKQSTKSSSEDDDELNLEESGSTPVDELNPRTKKRAAEQTADTILKGYARIAPMPFKWLAKVDEQKIERLAMEGQIDINIEVEPGTTFDEYMKQTNEQVNEVFEVEEETLEEIREPLIEVLMEQKMELTPQQRLMMAVVSHLFQMLTVALKLRKQNNRILEYQKQMTLHKSVA